MPLDTEPYGNQGTATFEEEEPETEATKEIESKACGPDNVKYSVQTDKKQHPMPDPLPDKALISVVRPTMMGNKIQTKLAVDKEWMGVNRGNNYFYVMLEPGTHYFCSRAENRSVMALKVEPGKTYYVQQKLRMGFMKARNRLELLSDEEGKKALAKCHLSVSQVKQ